MSFILEVACTYILPLALASMLTSNTGCRVRFVVDESRDWSDAASTFDCQDAHVN